MGGIPSVSLSPTFLVNLESETTRLASAPTSFCRIPNKPCLTFLLTSCLMICFLLSSNTLRKKVGLPKETVGRVRAVLIKVLTNDDKEDENKEDDDKEDNDKEDNDTEDDDVMNK